MPHLIVKMVTGRSREQKDALAVELTRAVNSVLGCGEDAVSVAIEDFVATSWVERVYVPDIQDRAELIYKKPGYDPFA
ncbi:4-oxalocrotonate tautomerase [Rhizobium sp. AC27/96]|uniref:tautomerase family protein n=2 Tax=Rhizobium TaxID=379 RepID=UPI00082890D3|nr:MULTISPECIES: tautomerase family protein [Rhizobium]OCJ10088.1 4-oxalocrotonate tautomerase [Rhizobium sp. AC27/96]